MKTYERNIENVKNGGITGQRFFQIQKEGAYVIRVLPPYSSAGVWYKQFREYVFQVGEEWKFLTAPYKLTDDPDPLFNRRKELVKEDNASKNEAMIKRLTSNTKFLMNIVVLSSPDGKSLKDGVLVAKFPKKIKDSLMEFDLDKEYGDITNLEKGFNIIIKKSGTGIQTVYQVVPQRNQSNLADIAAEAGVDISTWDLTNLDEVLVPASTEELTSMLEYLETNSPVPVKSVARDFEAFKTQLAAPGGQNEAESATMFVNPAVQSEPTEILNSIDPPNVEI